VAVQQYFEVLLSGIAGRLEEGPREMIREASERLTGLLQLVNDWLQLAKFDTVGLGARLRPVDLAAVRRRR